MFRRDLLKSALLGAAAIATGRAVRPVAARAAESATLFDTLSNELDRQLFGDDGLARPIPTQPTVSDLAKGLDRTLALGGGGEYYVAWYCGFFHGLYDHGLDMAALPEMVVGTSAGSYIGSSLTSGPFPAAPLAVRVLRPFSADLRSARAALFPECQPADGR